VSAYSAIIGITQRIDYECKGMNSTTVFLVMCTVIMVDGRDGVVGVTTHYGQGLGFELWWRRDLSVLTRPAPNVTQSPAQWVSGLVPGGKAAGSWS